MYNFSKYDQTNGNSEALALQILFFQFGFPFSDRLFIIRLLHYNPCLTNSIVVVDYRHKVLHSPMVPLPCLFASMNRKNVERFFANMKRGTGCKNIFFFNFIPMTLTSASYSHFWLPPILWHLNAVTLPCVESASMQRSWLRISPRSVSTKIWLSIVSWQMCKTASLFSLYDTRQPWASTLCICERNECIECVFSLCVKIFFSFAYSADVWTVLW